MNGTALRTDSPSSAHIKGIACILFAAFGFSLMSTFIRLAGNSLPAVQKAFFRNFVTVIVTGIMLLRRRISPVPARKNFWLLFLRSAIGTAAIWANFYAIDRLALADANMLNKFSPFAAILFSAVYLHEKPSPVQIIGVAVACLGSALIIKPGFQNAPVIASGIGLLGGIGAGVAYTFVRKLGKNGENSIRMIFFFSVFSCAASLPTFFFHYVPMTPRQVGILFLAGCSGLIGQFGITRAYLYAPASEISVYDYSQVIFATILGFLFFRQIPDLWSILGYVLICGAGIGMFLYNRR